MIILGYNNLAAPGIFESRIFFHHSNDSSLFFRSLFFSLSSSSYFFFFSLLDARHRDHRAAKVEQTVRGEDGKENRCRGGKRDQSERERERGREFITQRVTDNFYFSRVVGIDTTFPSRAVFFPDQHWRASASPWFFIGGVIRLEPRPTRIPILSFFSAFSFATPYYCSPSSPPV